MKKVKILLLKLYIVLCFVQIGISQTWNGSTVSTTTSGRAAVGASSLSADSRLVVNPSGSDFYGIKINFLSELSNQGWGLYSATSGDSYSVYGTNQANGYGIYGYSNSGYGIYGKSSSGFAGYFQGATRIYGGVLSVYSSTNVVSTFEVEPSNGQITTLRGLKAIAAPSIEVLEIKNSASSPDDVFTVKGTGQIDTKTGLKITTTTNTEPILVQNPAIGKVFKVTDEGKVYATEIEVRYQGLIPDYVFEKGYNLMPLVNLRNFLNENKHLPNIPSAKEINESGIGVGELQLKQLEKIEELTLYVLELSERLENLEKENQELKKLIDKNVAIEKSNDSEN